MKVATGIDIIEVDRIKKAIESLGDNFLNTIYTQREIDYCKKSNQMQYQHFAARFAAKEAIFKAISENIESKNDLWKAIEVVNDENGKPKVNVDNLKKYGLKNVESVDISLSHIKEYAVASSVVVLK